MKFDVKSLRNKLKRPYSAVSVAWQFMQWDWLESKNKRLCSKARALLDQWRKVGTKSRPKGPTIPHCLLTDTKDDQSSESNDEFDDDENREYDEEWISEMRRKHAMNSDGEYC